MSDAVECLRLQAGWCGRLGSPLYESLLLSAAQDAERGGPVAAVIDGYALEPISSAMALRLMGAVHRMVLSGEAPELARHYPTVGGTAGIDGAWPHLRRLAAERRDELRSMLERPVQTNEVSRSASLLAGFLTAARESGLPLRCLEIGTSAGLNLRWDRYRYEDSSTGWGDRSSPVRLDAWREARGFPFDQPATVVERAGCDPLPVDPTSEEGLLTLSSYLWGDQIERLELLRSAAAIAGEVPVEVERSDGAEWLERVLASPVEGTATVVFHSIVLQYVGSKSLDRILGAIREAGARATAEAPLAWLRMEPGGEQAEVTLTTWPGGRERRIATSSYHGRDVCWLGA